MQGAVRDLNKEEIDDESLASAWAPGRVLLHAAIGATPIKMDIMNTASVSTLGRSPSTSKPRIHS